MKVYLKPMYGDIRSNIDRAKVQLTKALGFRGTITEIKAEDRHILAEVKISARWDLPPSDRIKYLHDWLPTRVHHFEVSFR